jgi:hypothetical protein
LWYAAAVGVAEMVEFEAGWKACWVQPARRRQDKRRHMLMQKNLAFMGITYYPTRPRLLIIDKIVNNIPRLLFIGVINKWP